MKYCKTDKCKKRKDCERWTDKYITKHKIHMENNLDLIDVYECVSNDYKYFKKENNDKETTTKRD